ncbi:unnamed protein product [Darwinula stevensoni]|uniref:Ig-like domain-containing protein n=1 Tax=Darwinula stevensoni TaxID=69355 RepID=A0A7R9A3U6_9CRUS|nr:unnamed protein product [Darwinula stevensoni]CAG0892358.1 unnamed protein product [Darwinula stevensoni]
MADGSTADITETNMALQTLEDDWGWLKDDWGWPGTKKVRLDFACRQSEAWVYRALAAYDARESEVLHWSEDPSRMVFTPSRGVGFLSLSNVQAEDQGIYRCRVDYRAARTSTFSLNLSVIVPPSKPKVWDRDGVVIKSVIGPLKEGDSLFLACEVPDGRPPPTLSWWKDGVSVGRNQTLRVNGNSRSELLLESIRRSDLHSVVECRASNTPLVAPAVAQLSIDMNLAPLSLNLHPREGTSISGVPKEFICEVVGSRPPATISWSLAGESFTGNVTTSVLQLTPHPDDHGKVLQCLAENRILKGQHMKASIQLNVLYPPMASLALGSSIRSAHISEGMDVYLECSIRANPPPSRVNWLRNGVPLSPEATDRSLLLKRIQWDQGGKYTCEARNSQGVGSSNVLHLSVAYAPRCSNPSPRTEYVSLGELVYVPCTVRSNPKPSAFAWVFNNTTGGVAVPPSQFTSHNFSSVLSFTPVSQFDFGSLTCTARNGVSDADSRPCVVHIVHAGK